MPKLFLVNLFTRDLKALPEFYRTVFGFSELEHLRSAIFRGLDTGAAWIGFNAFEAYGLLNLPEPAECTGVKQMLNFDAQSEAELDMLVEKAQTCGARLIKAQYRTYYNWYQAVLADPEGNVFRIDFRSSAL